MFIEYLCNDWSQKLNLDTVICLKLIIFNVETSTFLILCKWHSMRRSHSFLIELAKLLIYIVILCHPALLIDSNVVKPVFLFKSINRENRLKVCTQVKFRIFLFFWDGSGRSRVGNEV